MTRATLTGGLERSDRKQSNSGYAEVLHRHKMRSQRLEMRGSRCFYPSKYAASPISMRVRAILIAQHPHHGPVDAL